MNGFYRISDDEFKRLIEPLLGYAGGYAFSIVRNREDAEDAVQEALLKAYKELSSYDYSKSFKAWWFTTIRNCCLDLLRKRQVRSASDDIDMDDLSSVKISRQKELEQDDEINWALSQLTPEQRQIIELRYFGDCSYREISETLGIPEGTVMSRLHSARQSLVDIYRKEKENGKNR